MNRTGDVRHEWSCNRDTVWPELAGSDEGKANRYFRRVRLLGDGSLLAIYEYVGLVRLDRDSKLVWAHQGWNHHDFDLDEQGRIFVLGRDVDDVGRRSADGMNGSGGAREISGKRVYDENISVLSPAGELLRIISLVDCLEASRYAPLLDAIDQYDSERPNDILHSNTVKLLDGSCAHLSPAFKKGNILTSFRNISTIAIIDPDRELVVWAMSGAWRRQHDPELLEGGTMLLFENYAIRPGVPIADATSRVVEFDPFTQEVVWEYRGTPESPLFSSLMGTAQRLPNGNTLITESDFGRAIEVTGEGRIVWEFNSPHTAGDHDEFVAVVPEMIYIPEVDVPVSLRGENVR